MEEYKVRIGAEAIDSEFDAVEQRAKDISKKEYPIHFKIDPKTEKSLDSLKNALDNIGKNSPKLDLNLDVNEITAVKKGLVGLGNTIDKISRVFDALEKSVGSLSSLDGIFGGSLRGLGNINANLNDFKDTFDDIHVAIESTTKAIDQLKKKTSSFTPKIDLGLNRTKSEKDALIDIKSTDLMPDLKDHAEKLMAKLNIKDIFGADDFARKYYKGSAAQYSTKFKELYRESFQGMHQLANGERNASATEQADAYRKLISLLREYTKISNAKDMDSLDNEFAVLGNRLKELDDIASGADIDKRLKGIFDIDTSKIESSLERIAQAVDKVNESLEKLGNGDPQVFANITSELHDINEEFKKIKNGLDSLNQSFSQFNGDTRFKDLTDSLNSLPQAISQLNNLAGSITDLSRAILVLQQDCDRINLAMTQGAQAAQRLRNAYGQIPNGMSEIGAIDLHLPDDNQIDRMRETLRGFGFDNIDTQNISRELDEIFVRVNKIRTSFNQDGSLRMVVSGTDKEGRDVTATSRYRRFVEQDGSERFVLDSDPVIELTERFNGAELACQDLLDIITRIGSTEIKLAGLDPEKDIDQISQLTHQLELLEQVKTRIINEASSNNLFSSEQSLRIRDASERMADRVETARAKQQDRIRNQQEKELEKVQNEANEITIRFNDGVFSNEVQKITNDLQGIKYQSEDSKNAVDQLNDSLRRLELSIQSGNTDSIIGAEQDFNRAKDAAKAAISANKSQESLIKKEQRQFKEKEDILRKKANEIADEQIKLDKLNIEGGSAAEIEELTKRLEELRIEYQRLNSVLTGADVDVAGLLPSDIQDRIDNQKLFNQNKYNEDLKKQADNITDQFKRGDFKTDFVAIENSFIGLENKSEEVENAVNDLKSALQGLDAAVYSTDSNQIIKAKKTYDDAKILAENAIKQNRIIDSQIKAQQKAQNDTAKLDVNKRAFESGMDVWLNKNSEAADYFADRIANIRQRLKECDATELTRLRSEFTDLKRQAELAGKTVKSFGDRLSDQFKRFGTYFALDNIIDEAVQGIRDMYDQVVQIDSAMTDLYKVTDETPERYSQFLKSSQDGAKELGRSVSSYITQSAKWAQMGYGIDQSEQLAKVSSIYANVADVTDEVAVSDIVSNLKAFGIEAEKAISVVDVLNNLSNKYAVTAAGLGQGLTNSASAMAMSNATFEQTTALLTGIAEITQSPSEAGSFLKVASMRIRGLRTFKPITYENMYLLSSINNKVA